MQDNNKDNSAGTKLTIAVISHSDFLPDQTNISNSTSIGLPDILAERILEHLTNSKRFIPVERKALRKVVLEQRFGQKLKESYVDRTLFKAIEDMEKVNSDVVATVGNIAQRNDMLKDFQDLGSAVGAHYLVLGNLEKISKTTEETPIPFSNKGRTISENVSDARIRLRVIDVKSGTVVGATSFRTKVTESIFKGRKTDTDDYSFFDHLGRLAAVKILDVTFPARVVSLDPLVISRGLNDGVNEGDVYRVEREGKEIKDTSGVVIGRIKSDVGRIEIKTPQETMSIVKQISGDKLLVGDLVSLDIQASEKKATYIPTRSGGDLSASTQRKGGSKATIAVGLLRVNKNARTIDGFGRGHVNRMTDDFIIKLTNTNRFTVMERQEIDQIIDEKDFESVVSGNNILDSLKELAGADYLILGEISNFYTNTQRTRVPLVDEVQVHVSGIAEGNIRIVDVHTGAVIAADKININERIKSGDVTQMINKLMDDYTTEAVNRILERLYPIKVLMVNANGTLYINRGDDVGMRSGLVFDVMHPGEEMIDPDTGISFGKAETKVATVKILTVEASRSTAIISSGGNVAIGDILRKAAPVAIPEKEKKVVVKKPAW
ncbi:MAG: hypothetical protein D6734_05900 [Candidatus Schekmanbacteria bacterium]|nr:MAG: hypothetical protein D6734_05900 [Candidatus Schekmanbacteria bacterium]